MKAMDTEKLIRHLADRAAPVRPLPRPWVRTSLWLALAGLYIMLVVVLMSPRDDLAAKLCELRFLIEQAAALATGIAAAAAAFATIIPGCSRRILLLPALPFAVWLGTLGQGCVQTWLELGSDGLSLHLDGFCFPSTVLAGAVPAIAMAMMLRRGAPLTPIATAALGGLAAAGLGNFGLRFFHPEDASLMVLVWQIGSVLVLTVLAGWAGRYLLSWRTMLAAARGATAG